MIRVIVSLIVVSMMITACTSDTNEPPSDSDAGVTTDVSSDSSADSSEDTPEMRGQALFTQMIDEVGFSCASCHHLTDARLIGPGMDDIDVRHEDYDTEESLEAYIATSIINPMDFIPDAEPAYPENVMPSYDGVLSDDEISDLVAYIISL